MEVKTDFECIVYVYIYMLYVYHMYIYHIYCMFA